METTNGHLTDTTEDTLSNEAKLSALLSPDANADASGGDEVDSELAIESLLSDPTLVQLIARRDHDGVESISGHFRVAVLPGQKRVSWHFPITPALAVAPVVEAETVERTDIRIRTTDRQKFGVRLELILAQPAATAESILVAVNIMAPPKT